MSEQLQDLLGWLKQFLMVRGMEHPNGRPLYEYKLSDLEFNALHKCLKKTRISFHLWDILFVLYASEWLRRNFSGLWKWFPLFQSLEMDKLEHSERIKVIERGFRYWKRPVQDCGKKYLGSLMLECGFPIQTLQNENGWLYRVLTNTFAIYSRLNSSSFNVCTMIAQRADICNVPDAFQCDEFYQLIARVLSELSNLKNKYNLADKEKPSEYLDENFSSWRDSFPLPIDSQIGREFLNKLLSEIAHISSQISYKQVVRHTLINRTSGWEIVTQVVLPKELYELHNINTLPSRMDVYAVCKQETRYLIGSVIKTIKNDKYLLFFSQSVYSLPKSFSGNAISIELRAHGSMVLSLDNFEDSGLDVQLPWVFAEQEQVLTCVGQASCKIADEKVYVVVPKKYPHEIHGDNSSILLVGELTEDSNIFMITGDASFYSEDNDIFHIHTASVDALDCHASYRIEGKILPYSSPMGEIYIGKPHICIVDILTGYKRKISDKIEAKPLGINAPWKPFCGDHVGRIIIRLKNHENEVVYRKNIIILPSSFSIKLKSDKSDVAQGTIIFSGIGNLSVHIDDEKIVCEKNVYNNSYELKMRSLTSHPPKYVTMYVAPSDIPPIPINIPFPCKGIRVFDDKGKQLNDGDTLFLNKLHGIRAYIFNADDGSALNYAIHFRLRDEKVTCASAVYYSLHGNVVQQYESLNLIEHIKKMRHLLAVSEELDAFAAITFECSGRRILTLNAYQYEGMLTRQGELLLLDDRKISCEQFEQININALLLGDLELEPEKIYSLTSEGVHIGRWLFSLSQRSSGSWLIYPDQDSVIQFRPMLWTVGEEKSTFNVKNLKDAVNIFNEELRRITLENIVDAMSYDFSHESWLYIDKLWGRFQHLPLDAFDVLKVFAVNQRAMVAMLCRQDEVLTCRMPEELPVFWELISLDIWESTFLLYYSFLQSTCGDLAEKLLQEKLSFVEKSLNLESIAQHIRKKCFLMPIPKFSAAFLKNLLDAGYRGTDGRAGLFNRHSNDSEKWSEYLRKTLVDSVKKLPPALQNVIPNIHHNHHQAVVYLPFILAYQNVEGNNDLLKYEPSILFKMQLLRDFDEEWFKYSFNLVQNYWSGFVSQEKDMQCRKLTTVA